MMTKRNKKLSKKHSLRATKLLQEALSLHQAGRLQEAEALYQSILQKYPQHPDAMHLLGVIALQSGKNEIAINLIRDAIRIKPNNAEAHYNLGNALIKLEREEDALTHYEQALAIKPDYAEAHYNLGNTLNILKREEDALTHFEQALAIKPDYAKAHHELGNTFNDLGRMEDAKACFKKVIATKPDFAEAHRLLTIVEPMQEQIPVIETLLSSPSVSDIDAMHFHYALGNLFNDAKVYDKAFGHYLKANTLKRKTIDYDSQKQSAFVDKQIKSFSKNYFQEKMAYGSNSELPVFILGMPRSGTTLVEQIISSHPQVYGAGELDYLPDIVIAIAKQFESSSRYPECIALFNDSIVDKFSAEYLEKIKNYSPNATRITDKMPANFFRIGIIKILFPQARIIHCQRNAIDTCTSNYLNYFSKGNEYSFDLSEIGQYYLDYERLMAHWHNLFHSEIFDVQYEELVMNQESISHQLIEYIGLDWDEKCLEFHKNNRVVRTVSNTQVRQPMYKNSINRWERYGEELQPLKKILQQHI